MKRLTPIVLLLALMHWQAGAFELTTHGLLTYRAYKKSALSTDLELLRRLGIDQYVGASALPDVPFGDTYVEMSLSGDRPWLANRMNVAGQEFDCSVMPNVQGEFSPREHSLTIAGWLMRGAIREDDDPNASEPNPKDDTPSGTPIHRVFRHFFDPANNRGLRVYLYEGVRAPDWASGYLDSFEPGSSLEIDPNSENFFSVTKAREAIFRAMTLRARNPDGSFRELWPEGSGTASAKEADRKRYWATTFRSLGDAVHLVQDMAQPQHTRNEPHAGVGFFVFQPLLASHKSVCAFPTTASRPSGSKGNVSAHLFHLSAARPDGVWRIAEM